jgi:hypothetical protein
VQTHRQDGDHISISIFFKNGKFAADKTDLI